MKKQHVARAKKRSGRGVVCEAMEGRVLMSGTEPAFNSIRLDLPTVRMFPGGYFGVVAEPTHQVDGPPLVFAGVGGSTWTPYFGEVDFYLSGDSVAGNGDDLLIGSGTTIPKEQNGAGRAYASGTLPETVAPGSYHLVAKLGTGEALLGDAVEVDPVVPGVDLYVMPGQPLAVSAPSTWVSGDLFVYAVEVWNRGTETAAKTSVDVYLSPTPSLSPDAIQMDRGTVPGGLPRGSQGYAFSSYSPSPAVAPGTYYMVAVIDPDNVVAEYDETNNVVVASQQVTVTAPTVDLSVADVTWPAGPVWPEVETYERTGIPGMGTSLPPVQYLEAHVPVSATVRSTGTGTDFSLQLVLSKDDVAGNADDLVMAETGLFRIAGGGASGSFGDTMTLRFNETPAEGTYRMILRLRGMTTDMTPGDNVVVGPMVTVGGADLSLTGLTASGVRVVAGGSITPVATAHVDALRSQGVTVRYALSKDGVAGNEDDVVLGTDVVWARSADSLYGGLPDVPWNLGASPAFVVPAGTPAGVYKLVAVVDPEGAVNEPDEANNAIVGPSVTVLEPELVGRLVPAGSSKAVVAGASGRAVLRLRNREGTAVSRRYAVRLYLSTDAALSADDRLFSKQTIVARVGAKTKGEVELTYRVPTNASLGTQYLIAVADVPGGKKALRHKGVAAKGRKMTSARVEAAARVKVVGPALRAKVRSVKEAAGVSRVVVRVRNASDYAFEGMVKVKVSEAGGAQAVLKTVKRQATLRSGGHVDWVVEMKGLVGEVMAEVA